MRFMELKFATGKFSFATSKRALSYYEISNHAYLFPCHPCL